MVPEIKAELHGPKTKKMSRSYVESRIQASIPTPKLNSANSKVGTPADGS